MFPGGDWEGQDWDALPVWDPELRLKPQGQLLLERVFLPSQEAQTSAFAKIISKETQQSLQERLGWVPERQLMRFCCSWDPVNLTHKTPSRWAVLQNLSKMPSVLCLVAWGSFPSGSFPSMQDISENRSNEFLVGIFFSSVICSGSGWVIDVCESLHWLASLYFKF